MKDYKRLTNRDLVLTLNYNNGFEDDKRRLGYALRLWELENKIERGEIDYVAEWKHRAEVAEKKFELLYAEASNSIILPTKEKYKEQAEKEIEEEQRNV